MGNSILIAYIINMFLWSALFVIFNAKMYVILFVIFGSNLAVLCDMLNKRRERKNET